MPLKKFMLDTNCFDFIFDRRLLQEMVDARKRGKIKFYLTTVQLDEIEPLKNKDPTKYEYMQEVIQRVPVEEIYIYGVYVGIGEEGTSTKRVYRAPRIGHAIIADHDALFDQQGSKLKRNHPVGDRGDFNIIRTAYCKYIDYIVTNDLELFNRSVNLLRTERGAKFQVISNADLQEFLKPN
jgi:rRNA-processing protein FCF1